MVQVLDLRPWRDAYPMRKVPGNALALQAIWVPLKTAT
jgi:hypothetical protein